MPPQSLNEWARLLRNGSVAYTGTITVLPTDLDMLADEWAAQLRALAILMLAASERIRELEANQEEMAGGGY